MKVKIIYSSSSKPPQMEADVNEWFAQHPNIKVITVTQPTQFYYSIFYEE